jgi:hypothetical protein
MFIPAWDYAHERMERKPSLGMYGSPTKGWLTRFIIPEASLCGSVSLLKTGQIVHVHVKAHRVKLFVYST